VKRLRLETGEAAGDGLEALAHGIEMVQSLLETEIGEIVGDQLVAQKGGELFVLLQRLGLAITIGAVRYPGIKIHDPRVIRLLQKRVFEVILRVGRNGFAEGAGSEVGEGQLGVSP
jgi:hypothetical protein